MKHASVGVLSRVAVSAGLLWASVLSSAAIAFVHPGLLNTRAEYELMKTKVAARVNPWYTAYQQIPNRLGYTPHPVSSVSDSALAALHADGKAAYDSALRWVVSGDPQHRDKAKQILNAWSYRVTSVPSTWTIYISQVFNRYLYAAEIMKHTSSGWSSADQNKFGSMVRLFLPRLRRFTLSGNIWDRANPALSSVATRMAAAVYLDDTTLFNQTVSDYKAAVNFYIGTHRNPVPTGFTYETCRKSSGATLYAIGTLSGGDIKHAQYGLGGLVQAAEIAKKQGLKLYSHTDPSDGASLRTALLYHASFVGVSSASTWPCQIPLSQISTWYHMPWQMAYNHYRDASMKSVVNRFPNPSHSLGPYRSATTGAFYEMLTHNYGSASSASAAISSPTNVRVVSEQ